MNQTARVVHWGVWGLLTLVVLSVVGVFISTRPPPNAPPLPVYGVVPDFSLTNQFSQVVSRADLGGQIWVANIIFTRCPGPCLEMTRKMKAIQDRLPRNASVKLVSLTADPAYDTPAVLNQYAARHQAHPGTWHFLTGPKDAVYRLATAGLKLAVQENTDGKLDGDAFIHSTRFVIVDGQGRLRAVSFEGTEAQMVEAVLRSLDQLSKEQGR